VSGATNKQTVSLCPNHHRFANEIQRMMFQGETDQAIRKFAEEHFDDRFNEQMLEFLIEKQRSAE